MNNNLLLTESVKAPARLDMADKSALIASKKNEQIAKNFEGLFLNKIVEQINKSVEEFGEDEDGQAEQIRGMFSMFLTEHISNSGGFGLWKKIYQQLSEQQTNNIRAGKTDNSV